MEAGGRTRKLRMGAAYPSILEQKLRRVSPVDSVRHVSGCRPLRTARTDARGRHIILAGRSCDPLRDLVTLLLAADSRNDSYHADHRGPGIVCVTRTAFGISRKGRHARRMRDSLRLRILSSADVLRCEPPCLQNRG